MSLSLKAIFDGEVFRPEKKPPLAPQTEVQLTVDQLINDESHTPRHGVEPAQSYSFLLVLAEANLEGPTDASANLDHYLYGDPNKAHGSSDIF